MEIFTKRRVLREVSRDLKAVLGDSCQGLPIDLYLGLHIQLVKRRPGRIAVGIQTEHFGLADDCLTMHFEYKRVLRYNIRACDYVIDYAERNSPFYGRLGLSVGDKFKFGPFVFPTFPIQPSNQTDDSVAFVGSFDPEAGKGLRSERIARYQQMLDLSINSGLYRGKLKRALREYAFLANIHRFPGVYTEVPRLLKAYLNGMVLVSEDLGPPFQAGRHYTHIEQPLPTAEARAEILRNIESDFAAYQFSPLLHELYQRHLARPAPALFYNTGIDFADPPPGLF